MIKLNRKIFVFLVLIVFSIALYSGERAKADSEDNVYGWAWSVNIGWISFNSTNCDSDGNGFIDDLACGGDNSTTPSLDYGVKIDSAGLLSGYAWSENIGWISFNTGDLVACPGAPVCKAWLDLIELELDGWARVLSMPDGWIKLKGAFYGVSLNTSPTSSEFEGWAWSEDIGWISFNCSNQPPCTIDYKVMTDFVPNSDPSAIDLSETEGQYCFKNSPPFTLGWTFSDPDPGDSQSGYKIEIDEDSAFGSPRGCPNSQDPYYVDTGGIPGPDYFCYPDGLDFDTTYYWKLTVKDSQEAESLPSAGPPFSTRSPYPWPDFECNGYVCEDIMPEEDEDISFSNLSTACGFDTCTSGVCSYQWDFGDGNDSNECEPTHVYEEVGQYTVRLTAQSFAGSCFKEHTFRVRPPIPKWKEISPF